MLILKFYLKFYVFGYRRTSLLNDFRKNAVFGYSMTNFTIQSHLRQLNSSGSVGASFARDRSPNVASKARSYRKRID